MYAHPLPVRTVGFILAATITTATMLPLICLVIKMMEILRILFTIVGPQSLKASSFPASMSITVKVGLLSGRTASVTAGWEEPMRSLSHRAQTWRRKRATGGFIRESSGCILDAQGC